MLGSKTIVERNSKFNGKLKVVRNWGMGTYIQAGGLTQSGGIVNSMWQSTLKKLKKEDIKKCLILGLGGGTAAKIILKIWPNVEVTGVDIDSIIVELGQKYLDLNNVKIIIGDAIKIPLNRKYDLILVDLYKGDKFPKKFESQYFLESLTKKGIVIFNRLYYKGKKEEAEEFEIKLKKIFSKVERFYPAANLMFICR